MKKFLTLLSQPNKWAIPIAISLILGLVSILLGYNHLVKLNVGFVFYCFAAFFLTRGIQSKRVIFIRVLVLLIIPLVILPLHFLLEGALAALPSTIALILGGIVGWGIASLRFRGQLLISLVSVLILAFFSLFGFQPWGHLSSFGTFTGKTNFQTGELFFEDFDGNEVSNNDWEDRTILLDFWYLGCGACYEGFPKLERINGNMEDKISVEVFAVHIPQRPGQNTLAREKFLEMGYSFPSLFASREVAQAFGIELYPTVILLKNGREVFFKGRLKNAEKYLNEIQN